MDQLRNLSSRPTLLRDEDSHAIIEQSSSTFVGQPGPFGRARCLFTIPMAPVDIQTQTVVHDEDGAYLADPQGNVIGVPRITVDRLLAARWTEDTRRLAG